MWIFHSLKMSSIHSYVCKKTPVQYLQTKEDEYKLIVIKALQNIGGRSTIAEENKEIVY